MERFLNTNRDFVVDSAIQIPFGNQRNNEQQQKNL